MSEAWETGWTEEGRRKVVRNWQNALKRVAGRLESLEDTIVFSLLDRAQLMQNPDAYEPGKSEWEGREDESLFGIRHLDVETSDSKAGRFTTPEEVPFNKNLPPPKRKVKAYQFDMYSGVSLEAGNRVGLSSRILSRYLVFLGVREEHEEDEKKRIESNLCKPGDDGNHGSATDWDISCLRAIAERIHYGSMYVAECKFNMHPEEYAELIAKNDVKGMITKLTREPIENTILARVRMKVLDFQKTTSPDVRRHIDPEIIVEFYRRVIIPLTKDGEVQYLQQKKIA